MTTTAVGIARQSHGDGASVADQTARLREYAKREGWRLLDVHAEQDVSGGLPLAKRPGLLAAVEAIEAGKASVLIVAYFDRLVRSLTVQAEVVDRVEAAGGRVLTLDVGEVSNATAGSWLSGSMLGLVSEYHRRTTSERVRASHAANRAVGKWNGGQLPFYFRVDEDGRAVLDPSRFDLVREAFALRIGGGSVESVRGLLAENGVTSRSQSIARSMLKDERLVEVVGGPTFRRAQSLHLKRGSRPKSERLLARLDVLECATCGSRMVVNGSRTNQTYRCGGDGCSRKLAISCHLAEDAVVQAVQVALLDHEGRSGVDVAALTTERDRRVALLDAAIESFSAIDPARTAAKLADLQAGVDAAEDALAEGRDVAGFTVYGPLAFEVMSVDEKRELIRAAVESAVVGPGVGKGRVRVTLAAGFAPEAALDVVAQEAATAKRIGPRDGRLVSWRRGVQRVG